MADDYDRPHHHIIGLDNIIYTKHDCYNDDTCDIDNPTVLVALDDYRRLVAAARDRHPTNHDRGSDPARRADGYTVNVDRRWFSPSDS